MTDPPYDPENFRRQLDAATDAQKEAVIMAALKFNHEFTVDYYYGPSAQEAFKELCDTLIPVVGEWISDEPEVSTSPKKEANCNHEPGPGGLFNTCMKCGDKIGVDHMPCDQQSISDTDT